MRADFGCLVDLMRHSAGGRHVEESVCVCVCGVRLITPAMRSPRIYCRIVTRHPWFVMKMYIICARVYVFLRVGLTGLSDFNLWIFIYFFVLTGSCFA